jgi:hypothetical protein
MRPENKRNTNIGIGVGILLQFAGRVLISYEGILFVLGVLVVLAGAAAFIWGCMNYAEGKGHPKWLGLLGLLSLPGLIILFMFPDHFKGARW